MESRITTPSGVLLTVEICIQAMLFLRGMLQPPLAIQLIYIRQDILTDADVTMLIARSVNIRSRYRDR